MSEKESTSQVETPETPEPQKPILLTNGVTSDAPDSSTPSSDDELPEADDSDVVELLPDVLELTEEVDENDKVKPKTTGVGIVSYGEMRGIINTANEHAQTEAHSAQTVSASEQINVDDIMEGFREAIEKQLERPAVTRRIPTPAEFRAIETTTHEMLKNKREELNREILPIRGKIRDESSLKIIDGNLLAIMEISKETEALKDLSNVFLQLTSPNGPLPVAEPKDGDPKIEDANSALVYGRNFSNGAYLVLRTADGKLYIMGGKLAEGLDPEEVEELYEDITSAEVFLTLSQRIEQRIELDKEILPIAGKVRNESSLRDIKWDTLAIVEISQATRDTRDKSDATGNSGPRIEDADSMLVFARNFRDGIYLVLKSTITDEEALSESDLEVYKFLDMEPTEKQKTEKSLLSILGGKHAEKLKSEIVEEFYRKIKNSDDFFTLSKKIEERGERKKAEEQNGESPNKTGTDQ